MEYKGDGVAVGGPHGDQEGGLVLSPPHALGGKGGNLPVGGMGLLVSGEI